MLSTHAPRPIACIYLPNFFWQAEVLRRPGLKDQRALIMGDLLSLHGPAHQGAASRTPSGRFILDCSPGLEGVVRGMPVSEAVSRHGDAALIEADLPYYTGAFRQVLDNIEEAIPDVEDVEPGLAHAGIWGLEGVYGTDAQVVRVLASAVLSVLPAADVRIGVGENKWMAYVAATLSRPHSARKVTGEAGKFLAGLSVERLPVPYALISRLQSFGLDTLGRVADLQRGALEAQFGPGGGLIWELSNGLDQRPLVPRRRVEAVTEYLSFPDATVSLPNILSGIESLLARAFSRPEVARRYVRQADMQSQVLRKPPWTLRVAFKEPAGSKNLALFAIRARLADAELPGPLEDLRLTLSGLSSETGRQESLSHDIRQQDQLQEAVSQLRARLNVAPPIYQVRELEPWSRIPERRHALVQLSP